MAFGLATKVHFGMIDHSAEKTAVNLNFPPIEDDGSNMDTLFNPTTGDIQAVKTAIIGVTNGNFTRFTAGILLENNAPSLPAGADVQRETAIRVTYADTVTGKTYRSDFPCADNSLRQQGTDEVGLTAGAMLTLKQAMENNCVSEMGNPITVQSARFVGKAT